VQLDLHVYTQVNIKVNKRTGRQSEIPTITRSIKHKNTCTVEQELQLIGFLTEIAHKEVTDDRSFMSLIVMSKLFFKLVC